ncbi:MAG TPA: 4Fe-4S binding protein [Saprospiraceae bacterium]|mgnify:CR=1 FL=1|nr:4Fe-4S binding protein [Saprospiraceae bacterium]HPG07186.1 4Fe-4S binding protein [Saprospiraceae bacterium]HRV85744.1 4Fe-4S binding protein [Saprospiraceae bacterium]
MIETSMSFSNPHPQLTWSQRLASGIGALGLLILVVAWSGADFGRPGLWLTASLLLLSLGTVWFAYATYRGHPEGIKNNGVWFNRLTNRGLWGWCIGIIITGLYILLYFYPGLLGLRQDEPNTGLIGFFDHLSYWLKGKPGGQWFVYGTLYTLAILIFGIKFIWKYRHNRYQIVRTISVMFFQLCFAFLLPELMDRLNQPSMDLKNMWPLNYYFFFDWNLDKLLKDGHLGLFLFGWGLAMILVVSPVLTYFFGKRWYCSWVCGCGGLAETAGDPFRHLSSKSLKAWKIERWLIYGVLVFAVIMTLLVIYTYLTGQGSLLFINSYVIREWYGFFIGAIFSGVIGVGFYPILGSRVWCRFGCPMAAMLGLQQKFFSRFRITTNGGQCISCGNCSTYCEMGIDVRWYAQRGQNVVRASCVGCGICAAVCPRGVLRLENGKVDINQRTEELRTIHVRREDVNIHN